MGSGKGFKHGGAYGYNVKKCRCASCKSWNTKRMRELRERQNPHIEKPMTLEERVAEIEWIRGTDTLENIATRLGWGSAQQMFDSLYSHGYASLATDLKQKDAYKLHGRVAKLSDSYQEVGQSGWIKMGA